MNLEGSDLEAGPWIERFEQLLYNGHSAHPFSRFFACNLNLPEIWSERYFFSWRESTRLFLKSQGRVPRTSEMNQK
nr:MAG TPA: hypothetical protein [Caudoviricetes sp.]